MNRSRRHRRRAELLVVAATVVLGPSIAEVPAGAAAALVNESGPSTQAATARAYLPGLQQFLDDQASTLGERWAGSSVQEDGTALVGITAGPVPTVLAANPNVRIVTRRFSVARLDATMETVAERLNILLNPGVAPGTSGQWPYQADVRLDESVVEVTLDKSRASEDARVRAALADEISSGTVRVRFGTTKHVKTTSCLGPIICHSPWRGGIQIVNANGTPCTSGFVMKGWDGVRYQSTAGHCSPGPWSHNGAQIGFTAWARWEGAVDGRVVHQNNQSQNAPRNLVYESPTSNALSVTSKVTTPSTATVGQVCKQGFNGGLACGSVTGTNVTVNGRPGFGRFTSPRTCVGDSGGPVYGLNDVRAYGLQSAADIPSNWSCGENINSYFSWISNIEGASGYQVLLKTTTETLGPGQRMHAGDEIRSTSGYYALVMQGDGNLVLYGPTGAVWSTGTHGNAGAFVTMQNAGNLVVYNAGNVPLWARPASGYMAGSRLVVQNDRNVVIYSENGTATWATGTNI